jgi:hypothetical protein
MKMQHGHAAWTQLVAIAWTCNMEIWTWTIDMNKQHEHRHAASKWTCSIDMDMQHGFEHASWT